MLYIILLVTILSSLVCSILRTDCYESFSDPIIYLKISHYFPTGPLYLDAFISNYRYSYLPNERSKYVYLSYGFKRIDHECSPTKIFTSLGKGFNELSILIRLYVKNYLNEFADIYYIFQRGFRPGLYKMIDYNQNFMVHTNIIDDEENHFENPKKLTELAKSYLNSINVKNKEICIITNNNRAVILTPNYESFTIFRGYINEFAAYTYNNWQLIGVRTYPAFECNKSEAYSEDEIMFIKDYEKNKVDFYAINIFSKKTKFNLSNPKFYDIKNLKNVPNGYKQVFLMKLKLYYPYCRLKINLKAFYCGNNLTYYAQVHKEIYISIGVRFHGNFYRSPSNICEE